MRAGGTRPHALELLQSLSGSSAAECQSKVQERLKCSEVVTCAQYIVGDQRANGLFHYFEDHFTDTVDSPGHHQYVS